MVVVSAWKILFIWVMHNVRLFCSSLRDSRSWEKIFLLDASRLATVESVMSVYIAMLIDKPIEELRG